MFIHDLFRDVTDILDACYKVCLTAKDIKSVAHVTHKQSRCLAGVLNGNVGVMKSMMVEITDSTNIAQG